MAVTFTKFWNFFDFEQILVLKKDFYFFKLFYFSLKVFHIFQGKSEPTQRPAAAVCPDVKAWFK